VSCTNITEKKWKTNVEKVLIPKKNEEKINWEEKIIFSNCKNQHDTNFEWESKELQTTLDAFNKVEKESYYEELPYFISEYCVSKDNKKYIFMAKDKRNAIWRYDADTGIMEKAKFRFTIFNDYFNYSFVPNRYYAKNDLEKYYNRDNSDRFKSSFWKLEGNKILFGQKGFSLTGVNTSMRFYKEIEQLLKKESSRRYCRSGLTPEWNMSICFADIYYSYDYIKNIITEDKICSYYLDDTGTKKTLESCREFIYEENKYNFIASKKGVELFQSKNKDISIIEVDLQKTWVSFWGLIKNENFYKKMYAQNVALNFTDVDSIFWVVNWAFFLDVKDKNRTGLSFPIKSQWILKGEKEIKETFMDNEIPKRTIVITKSWDAKIFEWYKEKYLENKNYIEVSVAFSPEVTARRNAKIGRSYIWLKCKNTICNTMIFFIADNKTQLDIDKIIADYWVKRENIIMMDWW